MYNADIGNTWPSVKISNSHKHLFYILLAILSIWTCVYYICRNFVCSIFNQSINQSVNF